MNKLGKYIGQINKISVARADTNVSSTWFYQSSSHNL